jgi:predicted esterase
MKTARVLFLLSILASAEFCYAQPQACQYNKLEGFNYCEIVMGAKSSDKNLPLVVVFHFSSSTPEEVRGYFDSLARPVRLILPRGNNRKRGGYSFFAPDHYSKDSVTQSLAVKKAVDSIALFLKGITQKYKTVPVVSGISQGGDLSFLLALYYPQLIKAAFPIAGFVHRHILDEFKKTDVKQVPVFIFQGEDDPIVSLTYTQKQMKRLSELLNVSLFTYPKTGHEVSAPMKRQYSSLLNKCLIEGVAD